MRTETILMSLLALIVGFALVVLGAVLATIKWLTSSMPTFLADLINQHALTLALICSIIGVILLAFCSILNRHSYFSCLMGSYSVQDTVLQQLVMQCLSEQFPNEQVRCEVVIRSGKKIEVFADLPVIEDEQQEQVLGVIEQKLSELFAKQCQYHQPFLFHGRFKED